ncbi:MAG: hypothetical protein AAB116_02465, partial [Candidatus Poribacteria bacterium]
MRRFITLLPFLFLAMNSTTTFAFEGDGGTISQDEVNKFLNGLSRGSLETFRDNPTSPAIWVESVQLEALIEMYKASLDRRLLDELVYRFDFLLEHTSEKLEIRDVLKNKPLPAWGTTGYSCGQYFIHAVHTGMLTYPMAMFSRIVFENTDLRDQYEQKAENYMQAIRKALAIYKKDYKTKNSSGSYYIWPSNASKLGKCDHDEDGNMDKDFAKLAKTPLPFNMILAMGRTHIAFAKALEAKSTNEFRDEALDHLDIAKKLAHYFKSNLTTITKTDSYFWRYQENGRKEDTSHGTISVRFAALAFREKVYFTKTDMLRFANTFLKIIAAKPAQVRSHLDGTIPKKIDQPSYQKAATKWADLTQFNRRVYFVIRDIYLNKDGENLLGQAFLAKWKPNDHAYPITASDFSAQLPAFNPTGSISLTGKTGLYMTPDMNSSKIAKTLVTSCVKYKFGQQLSNNIIISYRHTADPINGDSCQKN